MHLIVQNILGDFENASTFISYFLDHGYQLTTIYEEVLCFLNDVIPYQPLMPLYIISDLEDVPSTNHTRTHARAHTRTFTHTEKFNYCDHRGLD